MDDAIRIELDENGMYTVDIVGLLFLLKNGHLPDDTTVIAEFAPGVEGYYFVSTDEESAYLISDEWAEDEECPGYLELNEEAMDAVYYVTLPFEEKEEKDNKAHYLSIDYLEALELMEDGETVYLDSLDHKMEAVTGKSIIYLKALLEGDWFKKQDFAPAVSKDIFSSDSYDERLAAFFTKHEKETLNTQTNANRLWEILSLLEDADDDDFDYM